jgi:hypothetical protein
MVDILKFVSHEVLKAIGEPVARRISIESGYGIRHKIVESSEPIARASALESRIDADKKLIVRVSSPRRGDKHRFPFTNCFDATFAVASILLLGMFGALRKFFPNAVAKNAENLTAVGDEGPARKQSDILKVTDDAKCESVPRLNPKRMGGNTDCRETRFKAALGGLVKHHGAHVRWSNAATHEFRKSMHHRCRFPTSRNSEHGDVCVVGCFDHGTLLSRERGSRSSRVDVHSSSSETMPSTSVGSSV